MLIDRIGHAQNVSQWTDLGVKLPDALVKAISVFDVIRWTEVGHGFDVDLSKVTAANAEATIRGLAEHLAVSEDRPGALSPMANAKQRILDHAARALLFQAGIAVPGVIEQLTSEFDRHAEAYIEDVRAIYRLIGDYRTKTWDLTAETLIDGGTEAVKAYTSAQEHAAYLGKIAQWVSSTTVLPGHHVHPDPVLAILRPETMNHLGKLDEGELLASSGKSNPTLNALNPVFVRAALNRIAFGINTLPEAEAIRSRLSDSSVFAVTSR